MGAAAMFAKFTNFVGDAAGKTSEVAQRAKLEAEVAYLRREIRLSKERFGAAVFDVYLDRAQADALYAPYVAEIQEFENLIQSKCQQIEAIGGEALASSSSDAPPAYSAEPAVHTPAVEQTSTWRCVRGQGKQHRLRAQPSLDGTPVGVLNHGDQI